MNQKTILFFATGAGVGFLPGSKGTYGSVVAVLLYAAVAGLGPWHFLFFTVVFSLFSIWVADLAESHFQEKDSQKIVIDEIAGYLVTMLFLPFDWKYVLMAFVLFRLFDIWKPWPIGLLDRKVKGGLGIVGDDLLAGVFGNLTMQILIRFL